MQAEDVVDLAIPLAWLAVLAAEALWPRRRWPAGPANWGRPAALENPA